MSKRRVAVLTMSLLAVAWLVGPVPAQGQADTLEPLVYTIRFPQPASKTFTVDVVVPTREARVGRSDDGDLVARASTACRTTPIASARSRRRRPTAPRSR